MPPFRPVPDESPALVPPSRRPPTAVGLATLPPELPPRHTPWRPPAKVRALLVAVGAGLIVGGAALSQLSLFLLPVSVLVCWFGMDGMIAGVLGHRSRGLVRVGPQDN